MHAAEASAVMTALCCVCLLFLRSLSGQRTNSRNTLTDTVSQHCYSGNESAVLNRIAFPQPPSLLPPAPLSLAQSVVIPRGCESSLCTRLLNSSWLFPEWNCTHAVISGQFQQSHQHHIPCSKLTPAAFPEVRVCFGLLCDLSFTGFFSEEVDLKSVWMLFSFDWTWTYLSVEILLLRGH